MIADIKTNEKLITIVTELFLRERRLNISLSFHNLISKYLNCHTLFYHENT